MREQTLGRTVYLVLLAKALEIQSRDVRAEELQQPPTRYSTWENGSLDSTGLQSGNGSGGMAAAKQAQGFRSRSDELVNMPPSSRRH